MFKGYAYLFIEGYLVQDHEMILHAIELAKEAGLQICLDMASYNIVANDLEFFSLLISKYVDIVFANEEEARAFTGKEPKEALGMIAKKCSIAIVKVGANGSYIRKGTEEIKVSAIPVQKVVDTTGAGDYFASGFLYGLTCGYSLDKCAKIGSILSGNVIQVIGRFSEVTVDGKQQLFLQHTFDDIFRRTYQVEIFVTTLHLGQHDLVNVEYLVNDTDILSRLLLIPDRKFIQNIFIDIIRPVINFQYLTALFFRTCTGRKYAQASDKCAYYFN